MSFKILSLLLDADNVLLLKLMLSQLVKSQFAKKLNDQKHVAPSYYFLSLMKSIDKVMFHLPFSFSIGVGGNRI